MYIQINTQNTMVNEKIISFNMLNWTRGNWKENAKIRGLINISCIILFKCYMFLHNLNYLWGTVAEWISHLLTVPRDPGSIPSGGKKLLKLIVYSVHMRK